MLVAIHILFSFLMLTAGVELNDKGSNSFRGLFVIDKNFSFFKTKRDLLYSQVIFRLEIIFLKIMKL